MFPVTHILPYCYWLHICSISITYLNRNKIDRYNSESDNQDNSIWTFGLRTQICNNCFKYQCFSMGNARILVMRYGGGIQGDENWRLRSMGASKGGVFSSIVNYTCQSCQLPLGYVVGTGQTLGDLYKYQDPGGKEIKHVFTHENRKEHVPGESIKPSSRRGQRFMSILFTCGRFAAICLWRESRSFSVSWSLISVSPRRSCVSLKLSINLSLSSSIDTMSCSKFASSPENWEPLWLILSSDIVGITSHIMFHMVELFTIHPGH